MARSLTVEHTEEPRTSRLLNAFLLLALGWLTLGFLAAGLSAEGTSAGAPTSTFDVQ